MALDQIDIEEDEKNMSFFDHVSELRSHIVRALLAIVICGILAFVFNDFVMNTVIFGPKSKDFITYRILCYLSLPIGLMKPVGMVCRTYQTWRYHPKQNSKFHPVNS